MKKFLLKNKVEEKNISFNFHYQKLFYLNYLLDNAKCNCLLIIAYLLTCGTSLKKKVL